MHPQLICCVHLGPFQADKSNILLSDRIQENLEECKENHYCSVQKINVFIARLFPFFNPVRARQHNVSNSVFLSGENTKLIIYCPVTRSNHLHSGVRGRMAKTLNTVYTVPKTKGDHCLDIEQLTQINSNYLVPISPALKYRGPCHSWHSVQNTPLYVAI